jgi:hypothetical protein
MATIVEVDYLDLSREWPLSGRRKQRENCRNMREPSKRMKDSYALMSKIDTSKDEPAMQQQALEQEDGHVATGCG